ncbi:peptidoglycan/LPS O-acetylase OafA/YrhL [Variovorax sp. W1I1]|nr:acyltransferase [Variovorax sp. W1I1]MDQ0606614.1 peptidoglycan/LPS O-acetylase OafA/YrhL [Variovorax sp. W1I1]
MSDHTRKSATGLAASPMTSKQYRPDIDGLRAIAVISVFINHLSASVLPGGFIGVDIFFVISGFLITSQIRKEICEDNFSIKQFYKRRINRIAPVLMLVLVVSLLVGVVLLSPSDLVRLGKSSIYSMIGLSNVFFWREYGSYFAGNAAEAPLLHTWSLGVEEQFYLIWPLLTLLLFKLSRRYVLAIFGILTIAAIAVSQMGVNIAASAAYYLLPTRFFELMIGGVLALLIVHVQPTTKLQSQISLVAGFVLIIGSLALIGKSSPFPGIMAIWPCAGAALLIWAGSGRFTSSRFLLSRPMVFIGLISYSLYLWH